MGEKLYSETHEQVRNARLKREYGITTKDYNLMFRDQCGCCAICGVHQSKLNYTLHIDHSHETGEVRGLVCSSCNSFLGKVEKDRDILLRIDLYLFKEED